MLAKLGYNMLNSHNDSWMIEAMIRPFIGKYNVNDIFEYYNNVIQNQ